MDVPMALVAVALTVIVWPSGRPVSRQVSSVDGDGVQPMPAEVVMA
jgi:hypothetical protein